jgi:hypothetical protein
MRGDRCLIALLLAWSVLPNAAPGRADDAYVHTFTGFTFPPKVAAFARVKITPYNDAKSDIGVDYDNTPFTVHLSVYVYPSLNIALQDHYTDCRDGVSQVHKDAKLLEEKPVTFTKSGATYNGYRARFSFRDKFVGDAPQDLLLFQRGDYFVLFRISYSAADQAAAEKEIDDFLQQFAWPPGNPPTTKT